MNREEELARGEITRAALMMAEVDAARDRLREIDAEISKRLDDAEGSLKAARQLRHGGREFITEVLGKDHPHLGDILRLSEGDRRP